MLSVGRIARMAAPENGPPNRALKTHTSKVPARSGTSPMPAMMMPAGPPIASRPPAMSAMPPTIRTTRPMPDAMNWPNRLAANQLGFCWVWVVHDAAPFEPVPDDADRSSVLP